MRFWSELPSRRVWISLTGKTTCMQRHPGAVFMAVAEYIREKQRRGNITFTVRM